MGDIVTIDEQVFTDIADAIRDRNGETATYKPREMAATNWSNTNIVGHIISASDYEASLT